MQEENARDKQRAGVTSHGSVKIPQSSPLTSSPKFCPSKRNFLYIQVIAHAGHTIKAGPS
jgi:hypothetical protein